MLKINKQAPNWIESCYKKHSENCLGMHHFLYKQFKLFTAKNIQANYVATYIVKYSPCAATIIKI